MEKTKHHGTCHCGAVQFEFRAPSDAPVTICNCSICNLNGYQHIFVPKADLTFLSGRKPLTEYRFETRQAVHMFCKICGIKPLYQPRSHPDQWSVNLRCVTSGTLSPREQIAFDGQNWENSIEGLREKT